MAGLACRREMHQRGPATIRTRPEHPMSHGTQHFADDPRNADILIWINGEV
jgi:hypothetical protein